MDVDCGGSSSCASHWFVLSYDTTPTLRALYVYKVGGDGGGWRWQYTLLRTTNGLIDRERSR